MIASETKSDTQGVCRVKTLLKTKRNEKLADK